MAVRPRAVLGGALGQRRPGVLPGHLLGEHLGGHDAATQVLGLDRLAGALDRALVSFARRGGRRRHRAEQLLALVQDRHVRHRPRCKAGTHEGSELIGTQGGAGLAVCCRQYLGTSVEAAQQRLCARRHPRRVDRAPAVHRIADFDEPGALDLGIDAALGVRVPGLARQAQGQHVHEFAREGLSRHVMRAARALRPAPRALHVGARECHLAVPHAQHLVTVGELGQRPNGFLDDLRPRGQPLDPRHGLVLAPASVHAGHQVTQRHRDDARLAERR